MIRTSQIAQPSSFKRRLGMLSAMTLFFSLTACKAAPMTVTLDVVTFNYWNRPIFDVFVNGEAGETSTPYPETGGKTITGVQVRLGPQRVTWRLDGQRGTPRNGETVIAKNAPELRDVPPDARFLGVHVYPDETVELIPTRHYPQATEKGKAMAVARR